MGVPNIYRTPPSEKQLNIGAFDRLMKLAVEKKYRGPRLNDEKVEGLARCISVWLTLTGYKNFARGTEIRVPFQDGDFVISVENTHRTAPNYPPTDYTGEYEIAVHNLYGFEKWFNENLKTQDDD